MNNDAGVDGWITIREICKATGDILHEYTDKNVITEQGINTLYFRMVMDDDDNTMKFSRFKLGIDYGLEEDANPEWSVLAPKPAEKGYTSLNQFVVYDVPEHDMAFDYPDDNTFQASTLLDGKFILDSYFPEEVDMRYTSATLRFFNETTFSYKRFPVRSLSRLIDVQIIWTFKLVNQHDYICPMPPFESKLRMYSVEDKLYYYYMDQEEQHPVVTKTLSVDDPTITSVRALPSGNVIYMDSNKNMTTIDEDGVVLMNRALNITHPIKMFDVDQFGYVYAALDNPDADVAKIDSNGEVIWVNSIKEGKTKSINEIWIINNSRVAISTTDSTDQSPDTSGNMMHLISAVTGEIVYLRSIANDEATTGELSIFSSSGGELFAIQHNSTGNDYLIKLAYDLTEIHRIVIDGHVMSYYAAHDNFILIGSGNGVPVLTKYTADLDYIWSVNGESGSFVSLGVDRDDNIHACSESTYYLYTSELDLLGTHSKGVSQDVSVVGSKWTYFG